MDKSQEIVLAAVHNAVRKGIREIREDPKRSLRNLVDLGAQVGRGPFQKGFFYDAQDTLRNANSTYYALVNDMTRRIDPQTLETFGVNIGYMSWTYGANKIREYETQNRVNVPWTIFVEADAQTKEPLDLHQLVEQGTAMGIYTYILFLHRAEEELHSCIALCNEYPECAFVLYSQTERLNHAFADIADALPNVLFVLQHCGESLPELSARLTARKRLLGLACQYTADNADELLSDAFVQSACDMQYPFLCYQACPDCPAETVEHVMQAILRIRRGQKHPIFPINLYSDMVAVDHIISDETCSMTLSLDGTVRTPDGIAVGLDARKLGLEELIRRSMPRVHHQL